MWNHPELGMIPFTATPDDVVPYGVEIYNQLVAGDYGTVLTWAETHFYSTTDGNIFNGIENYKGDIIVSPTGTVPSNSTTSMPPVAGGTSTIYWYNDAWITSCFDPAVYTTLLDAQNYLKSQTQLVGNNAVNAQLAGYSTVEIQTAPDINALITFDYAPMTIGDYNTFISGNVAAAEVDIDASTYEELFGYDPASLDIVP